MVGEIAEPTNRFADDAKCSTIAIDAALPIARDLRNHKTGPHGLEFLTLEAHFSELSGPVILDDGVTCPNQIQHQFRSSWLFQVHGDAAFVACVHRPPGRTRAVDLSSPLTHWIAPKWLNLDHIGAEIRQEARAKGGGDKVAEFENAQPG